MNLSLYIAKRYIFSKKRHQVINIISGVAVAGVALAAAAMVCTLSVFNGFQAFVAEQFTAMDPEVKIVAAQGKSFLVNGAAMDSVRALPQIDIISYSVEDKAMVQYGGKQVMVTLKGVDDNFAKLTNIEKALYGRGEFILQDELNSYAVPGVALVQELNCGINYVRPLEIIVPNRSGKINLTMPALSFKKSGLLSSGLAFVVNQSKYDANYILTSIDFVRKIFRRDVDEVTSVELKVKDGESVDKVKKDIEKILGEGFVVMNRYEQQRDIYKVMQVEKLIAYLFLSFILLVACFNIIGALSMLIIEKRDNMNTLRGFGADNKIISNIFIFEGCLISSIGAVIGILLGLALCLLQQEYGLITTGGGEGFIMDSYPMEVQSGDVVMVFVTVLVVGFMAVWLPVRMLTKKFI
ncbi:MAG: ABC transporter permease [Bacteroidaceae bacterium]|nr:ABC transporter permease [Bacteroidaceae bacterium]